VMASGPARAEAARNNRSMAARCMGNPPDNDARDRKKRMVRYGRRGHKDT
jgi:hypothetical protein